MDYTREMMNGNSLDMVDADYQNFQKSLAELTRLAAAQIQVSMSEADDSVNQLTASFTDIINQDRNLRSLVKTLPDDVETAPIKAAITSQTTALGNNVRNSIIAFQFFDRMCQRLEHSIQCLKELSAIEESSYQTHMDEVERLKTFIYQSYTMEEERTLYDEILRQKDFEHAISSYLSKRHVKSTDEEDDVELF